MHQLAVLRRALAGGRLRRAETAFLGFGISEYGVWVVVLVFAFRRGGTTTAAIISAVQLLPASAVAPLAARLIDSRGAAATLWIGYLVQAASVGLTAGLMLSGAPSAVVYAAAVVAACAVTLTRPAHSALLPALVDTPAQLTAVNVVTGWVENVTLLAGPALASVALGLASAGWALIVFACVVAGSALIVAPLRRVETVDGDEDEDVEEAGSLRAALSNAPGALPALAMLTAEYAALGAQDVLEVVLAALVLGLGAGGAGYLGAAFGVGGLLGAALALTLVGRHRLARPLLLAGAAWGGAFVVLGAWPARGVALALLAIAGAGRTVLDVGGRTILHRTVPRRSHGRVFGALEGVETFGLGVGSLAMALVVALAGPRGAVAIVGGLLVVVPLLTTPILHRIERAAPSLDAEIGVLGKVPLFAMLNPHVLEDLARALERVEAPAGETITRESEPGSRYFVVLAGNLDVSIDGGHVREMGPGDGFGEIALLRDGVRTATVTATSDVTLYALERAPFLEAVTGSRQAERAAHDRVAELAPINR
ncbi:MAG TPA: cyclic nucleotide-binding domain-containing protein [Solirubrobacteraceae bacterium]|jgi:MFS family permease